MQQKVILDDSEKLIYKNSKIKICIICGDEKIDSFEFGVSCENCGTSFGRKKC